MDAVYTRTGKVQNDYAPFLQYKFPVNRGPKDEIRIQIPVTATRQEIEAVSEHLQIIAKHWTEEI